MALGHALLNDLLTLRYAGAMVGFRRVIEIGAQQIGDNLLDAKLDDWYDMFFHEFGGERPAVLSRLRPDAPDFAPLANDAPASSELWRSIGFDYASIDYDGHRDAIALDLNRDRVPRRMRGRFDIAVNTGTTEHVANQDNAFRVIHDLVRVDGLMYHEVPAAGMMNHGFVAYNPRFFWHLARENGYEVLIMRTSGNGDTAPVPEDIAASEYAVLGEPPRVLTIERLPLISITAVLRKRKDTPYVTPLDLGT
jgi:hypothetical protein